MYVRCDTAMNDVLGTHFFSPVRRMQVWHVACNAVGNPNNVGLLWPWTGGSEICDPRGNLENEKWG